MKAAVYKALGQPLSIETVKDPEPRAEDIVIKVHRCGICGTDLHLTSAHQFSFLAGSVLGHEYAGEVVEIGSAVTGIRKGDIVTALPSRGCGHCDACRRGNVPLCRNETGEMGGFGEYLRIQGHLAVKLPGTLSLADGALIEPLAVSLYGVRQAGMQPGDRVLVLGGGAVALTTIYWARRLGAGRIVCVSRSRRREAMALAMGADAFVQSGDNEIGDIAEALGGPPAIVFECVGATGIVARAIEHVATFGTVMSLGFCTAPDSFVPAMAGNKCATLKFSIGYTLRDFQHAANVMDKGHADPKMLITSTVTLDDMPAKFESLRAPNDDTKVHVLIAGT